MPKRRVEDRSVMDDLLARAPVGHLATCHAGLPYVTPLNFVYRDGHVYFHCAPKGRKLDNIAQNPRVCFEVSEVRKIYRAPKMCDYGCRYLSVLAFGTARTVEDPDDKLRILNWLVAKYAGGEPYEQAEPARVAQCAVVDIEIEEMTGKENVDRTGVGG